MLAKEVRKGVFVYTGLSGQLAAFKHLEVIANNLANMNTTGYRSERILFEKALTRETTRISSGAFDSDINQPTNLKTDEYVGIRGSFTDFSEGSIESSGNPLDVAIQGLGFFVVNGPDGARYTRSGNFRLDTSSRITTQDGLPVQGTGGDIVASGADIQITNEGEVLADGKSVGKFRIVQAGPNDLERAAGMLFKPKAGAEITELTGVRVQGGAVEGSNVNAVRELTDMIMASRIYDSFTKVSESSSKMSEIRNQKIGSTQG